MKNKKAIIFGIFLLVGIGGLISINLDARRRGRGGPRRGWRGGPGRRGWHGRRHYGPRHRRDHYRYGWGRPFRRTFYHVSHPRRYFYSTLRDRAGKLYWEVHNDKDNEAIIVYVDRDGRREEIRILPGESKDVNRWDNFSMTIENERGKRKELRTRDHYIHIENDGPIRTETDPR